MLSKLNPSTLSGALDIIIIEQEDGRLYSSPWHIRVGNMSLLHHSNKIISININNQHIPIFMAVDRDGCGRFPVTQQGNQCQTSISYPIASCSKNKIKIRPKDVRMMLSQKEMKRRKKKLDDSKFEENMIIRNSTIDLESSFIFEDPDPLPISTVQTVLDLSQSVNSQGIMEETLMSNIPSPELINSFRDILNIGKNSVEFTVSSLIQGPKIIQCSLFLFKASQKFIVSDVDGTITSSDLLGHVLPAVGKDWTHPGLANLYSKIAEIKNVVFIYLSSRPIGEAHLTRKMLDKIKQNGIKMPDGPLITCPDKLFLALSREIKHKPHEFKIPTIQCIQSLFKNDASPIVFGFGNRPTDVLTYKKIGLNDNQIILFNTKHNVLNSKNEIIYNSISELIEHVHDLF